jgi:uncharacterized protein
VLPIVTSHPADIELSPEPIPKDWILAGQPRARAAAIARSADEGMWVTAWACTPGSFHWHYNVDEMAQILVGEVFIIDEAGIERRLGPGDVAYFPAGTSAVWRITQEVRKLAMCRVPVPKPVIVGSKLWGRMRNRIRRLHYRASQDFRGEEIVYCGAGICNGDRRHPVNSLRTRWAELRECCKFLGFE